MATTITRLRQRTAWQALEEHFATIRDVQDGAVLGDVDVLAGEHRVDPLPQPRLLGQRDKQPERLVRDPVLRVVEVETRRLER